MSDLQTSIESVAKVNDSNNSKNVCVNAVEEYLHSREENRLQTSNEDIIEPKKVSSSENVNLMKLQRERTMESTYEKIHRSVFSNASRQVKEEKQEFANIKHDYNTTNSNYNLSNSTRLASNQLNKNSALRIQITSALADQHRRYLSTLEESWKLFLKANESNFTSCLMQQEASGVTKMEVVHRTRSKRVKRKELVAESTNITSVQNGNSDSIKIDNNSDDYRTNNIIESTLSNQTSEWRRTTCSRDAICNVLFEANIEQKWINEWKELMLCNSSLLHKNSITKENSSYNDTCTDDKNNSFDYPVTPEIKELIREHYVLCPSYSAMSASAARTREGFVWSPFDAGNTYTQVNEKCNSYRLFVHDTDYLKKPLHCIHLHLCSVCQLPALYRCTRCRTALFCSDKCYNIHQSTRCQKYIV